MTYLTHSMAEQIERRDAEIKVLRAEVSRLRDVLEWSEHNCTGKCKGLIADALRQET